MDRGESIEFLTKVIPIFIESTSMPNQSLFCKTLAMVNNGNFEHTNDEDHWLFWRVDAGIPIAKYFLQTSKFDKAKVLAYLIFQIRNNLAKYSVEHKVFEVLSELDLKNSMQRSLYLYLILEFIIHPQFLSRIKSARSLFLGYQKGYLRKIINTAWRHFIEDKRYPLLGLDVIFAVGVCYGMALIKEHNHFKFIGLGCTDLAIFSPELNARQQNNAVDYFAKLQGYVGPEFRLEKLKDQLERDSLNTISDGLMPISDKNVPQFVSKVNIKQERKFVNNTRKQKRDWEKQAKNNNQHNFFPLIRKGQNGQNDKKVINDSKNNFLDTVGDGNCFFHAVFGKLNKDGKIEFDNAQKYRKKWVEYMNQFSSINDENMPLKVKECLKNQFSYFFNQHDELPFGCAAIKKALPTEKRAEINNRIKEAQEANENFINKLVSAIQDNDPSVQKLIDQLKSSGKEKKKSFDMEEETSIKNAIADLGLKSCLEWVSPNISKNLTSIPNNHLIGLDNDTILEERFLKDNDLQQTYYQAYLETISQQDYYIYTEEIPILSAIFNTEIHLDYGSGRTFYDIDEVIRQDAEQKIGIRHDEQRNTAFIFHEGVHFSKQNNQSQLTRTIPKLQTLCFTSFWQKTGKKELPKKIKIMVSNTLRNEYTAFIKHLK